MHRSILLTTSAICGLALSAPAQAEDYQNSTSGKWEDSTIWTLTSGSDPNSNGVPDTSGTNVRIEGQAPVNGGAIYTVTADADTWSFFNSAGVVDGSNRVFFRQLRVGQDNTAILNVDIGDGNILKPDFGSIYFVGSNSGSDGTLNLLSGDLQLGTNSFRIAEKTGSTGLVNISGGTNTRLIVGRESGGKSMLVGSGGNGTFQIDGGKLRTRAGVTVGTNGRFRVLGSDVTEVEIGTEGSLDGNWTQNTGGILEVGIDAGGLTQINVADKVETAGAPYVTFDSGSLLDVGFFNASPYAGTWTVMELQNADIVDNGLTFAPGVDAGWSFGIDNSGTNGILTVTYVPEPTSLGLLALGGLGLIRRRR